MYASERTRFQLHGRAIIAAVCITSFPQKYIRAQACPPTKKATYRDYGKLIQWQISPIYPTQFWPHCFVRGMRLPLYKEGFWRTVSDLVPRNACRAQKATMVQDQPHGAHMLLSELTLARGSSIGAIQSGTPSVTMPYLIPSFLNINSFILKNSHWDIHHNFTLLFLKNKYTALSCTTSNRKCFQFVGM